MQVRLLRVWRVDTETQTRLWKPYHFKFNGKSKGKAKIKTTN
jgi:hypothetical protein